MTRYIVKINGEYFAGWNQKKVYAESTAQVPFRNLINICAKPDGLPAFDFTDDVEKAHKMDFFELSHNFIQALDTRVRYHYLAPIRLMTIIEVPK